MTRKRQRKLAKDIASKLFRNGYGQEAVRLVTLDKEGLDIGGWCKEAVVNQIMDLLKEKYQ